MTAEKKEEKARLEAQQKAACEEQLRARTEAARKRALEKEALKLAKQQTSAQASADRLRMNNMSNDPSSGGTNVSDNVVVRPSSASSSAVTAEQTTTGTVTPIAGSSVLTGNASRATTATSQGTTPSPSPLTSTDSGTPTAAR